MQFFNTLSGKKEDFVPLDQPQQGKKTKVGMYVCGPTPYDLGHLGHGRSAVSFDIIRKYLIYKGYEVKFVSNFTDIDDKMIARAERDGITVAELAARIIPEYQKDYGALGVQAPDVTPKATDPDVIQEMIKIIQGLEKKGHTYLLDDGVYFDITTFKGYGKLSKQKMDELKSGARVALKETKRNHQDFVLWKFAKPGEPKWESPWGEGRPGWHIECSAMSSVHLGETFDIHGGGADLTFPHHECEIAQSEAYSGKKFVNYWLHNGFIQVNHEKMSKSLGNFFTLRDIFKKFDPQVVRFFFLQTHYRSPIEFSDEVLQQAKNGLARLHDFVMRLQNYVPTIPGEKPGELNQDLNMYQHDFEESMVDDFETAGALAVCFDLVKKVNRAMDLATLSAYSKDAAVNLLQQFDKVLGVIFPSTVQTLSEEALALIHQREEARKNKDWVASDKIRDQLLAIGIQVEDTPKGTVWKKV